jgi:hypothetical protein
MAMWGAEDDAEKVMSAMSFLVNRKKTLERSKIMIFSCAVLLFLKVSLLFDACKIKQGFVRSH